jgi:hypothetical protein
MDKKLQSAIVKSGKALLNVLPLLVGVILLVGLAHTLMPKFFYLSKNIVLDSIMGKSRL